jgi:tetratricopeptide (TPR) repeat protein
MKRAAIIVAILCVCTCCVGQNTDKSATQNPPAGQAAPATTGKRPPQAKTQPEFDAYKAAMAAPTDPAVLQKLGEDVKALQAKQSPTDEDKSMLKTLQAYAALGFDPRAGEKAADDFAAKFPDSELRLLLYKTAMQRYQQANNADKMVDMARKALTYDPDDPESLLGVAQVLAERTHDTDLDKDQRLAEAKKDAERALQTVDTDLPTVGFDPAKLAQFKNYLKSDAYAVLGALASNAKSWPEAENDLRKSIDAFPEQIDSIAVLRLAVALDMQNKIPEALKYANQAVDLTKDHPDSNAAKAAREEQDRLNKLSGGTAPGSSPK